MEEVHSTKNAIHSLLFLYYQTIHSVILTTAAEKGYLENQSRSHGWKHDKLIHISFVFVVVVLRVMEKKEKKKKERKRKHIKTYKQESNSPNCLIEGIWSLLKPQQCNGVLH